MTRHSIDFRIYYEDTDAGGIVYHARYLAFAERARTEAIRALGEPASKLAKLDGLVFVVRRVVADYLSPLRLDDVATVTTSLSRLGFASCTLVQEISTMGQACATLEVDLACVRVVDGRPARFPPRWHDQLTRLKA